MAEWLKERKIESVAMESTGVYWIAPHEVLEKDFEVLLVDTRQLARVPGRNKKTDPSDCEWIQRLHSWRAAEWVVSAAGTSVHAADAVRDKANLVAESADWVRRMQRLETNATPHMSTADSTVLGSVDRGHKPSCSIPD
jgi:hypothetical protein